MGSDFRITSHSRSGALLSGMILADISTVPRDHAFRWSLLFVELKNSDYEMRHSLEGGNLGNLIESVKLLRDFRLRGNDEVFFPEQQCMQVRDDGLK